MNGKVIGTKPFYSPREQSIQENQHNCGGKKKRAEKSSCLNYQDQIPIHIQEEVAGHR